MRLLRGIITDLTSAASKIARVSFKVGTSEPFTNREHVQQFGFASVAPVGTTIFALKVGGVVITIGSAPGEKKPELNEGETALYNAFNERLKLIEGKFVAEGDEVLLGAGAIRTLVDERMVPGHNTHFHNTTSPGSPTSTPTVQIVAANVTTNKTKAE